MERNILECFLEKKATGAGFIIIDDFTKTKEIKKVFDIAKKNLIKQERSLKNRIITPVKEILVIDNENMKGEVMCYPITDHNPDKNKCPFLTENCRCNIYDRRPPICKKFGNGTEPLLTCSFLVPEEQRESVLAGYKSAINKLTSPAAWELAKKYK